MRSMVVCSLLHNTLLCIVYGWFAALGPRFCGLPKPLEERLKTLSGDSTVLKVTAIAALCVSV